MKLGRKKVIALAHKPAAKPALKKGKTFSISAYYAQRGKIDDARGVFKALAVSLRGNSPFASRTVATFGKVISSLI